MSGLTGYGAYIPRYRLKAEEIWDNWVNQIETPAVIKERRGLTEKVVGRWDEDAITMGVAAAKASLETAGIKAEDLGAVFFGSCTNPYASKAAASIVTDGLTDKREIISADCQHATKSGTAALIICAAMVDAGLAGNALAIGSDALSRHVPPADTMEYSASSGAAAFTVGKEKVIAEIENIYAYNTNTPEFFRLTGERYIKHGAGEDGENLWGFQRHVKEAAAAYFKKFGAKPGDFAYVAISQPDGVLPVNAALEIGFSEEQFTPGLLAGEAGDFGSASALLSLQAILDQAKANQRILVISYGFGAGCDVLSLRTTRLLGQARNRRETYASVRDQIKNKEYIGYAQYLKQERKLVQEFI